MDCIHGAIEAQVRRTPEATAIVDGSRRISYAALNSAANRLARALRGQGVREGALVGIHLPRGSDYVTAILATWKAGAAYVPLDPAYPDERVAEMLEGVEHLITTGERQLPGVAPGRTLRLDHDGEAIARQGGGDLGSPGDARALAYVIYTSGSTGRPKGVMIEHRSVMNLAGAHEEVIYGPRLSGPFAATLLVPFAFDGSVERLTLLTRGHTLHIISEALRQDPRALVAYLREQRVQVLDVTPAHLRVLLDAGLLAAPGALALALVGGEAIDAALWGRLAASEQVTFFNVYGPTECTVNASVCRVAPRDDGPSIGRELPGVTIAVVGEGGREVPTGEAGELLVGGAGLARGYFRRPELTQERFVDREVGGTAARFYRTGDLGRRRPDGEIEYLGRRDGQVKIRGHRIEVGEIEARLRAQAGVRDACVWAKETAWGKQLVGYVIPESAGALAVGPLRAALAAQLPEYMIPSCFVLLEALPVTENGKLDRAALPEPVRTREATGLPYEAPRTRAESALAALMAEVLKLDRVGIHDGFFELGGDSLLAATFVARASALFRVDLPVRTLFDAPTVNAFVLEVAATRLRQAGGGGA